VWGRAPGYGSRGVPNPGIIWRTGRLWKEKVRAVLGCSRLRWVVPQRAVSRAAGRLSENSGARQQGEHQTVTVGDVSGTNGYPEALKHGEKVIAESLAFKSVRTGGRR